MKLLWREPICKYSEGERCTFYNFYEKPFLSGDKAVWFHDFLTETYENVFSASFRFEKRRARKIFHKI